jgi:hypothetical protein
MQILHDGLIGKALMSLVDQAFPGEWRRYFEALALSGYTRRIPVNKGLCRIAVIMYFWGYGLIHESTYRMREEPPGGLYKYRQQPFRPPFEMQQASAGTIS